MKRLLMLMSAISMMFATSCDKDFDYATPAGENAVVSFNVTTPQMGVRAFSDGETATVLQYAVYDAAGNELTNLTKTDGEIHGSAKVELQLVTGDQYSVIFWAAAEGAPYVVDFASKTMTVNYTNAVSNDENRDAFYAYHEFTVKGAQTETIELKRPFAQLNIGTNDYAAAEDAGCVPTHSAVTVKNIYSTLDLVNGGVSNDSAITFASAAIPQGETFPVNGYDYLAMNYLLVGSDKETVEVDFTYTYGSNAKTRTVGSVPVQRNYRTNIYGSILTSEVDVNVEIKPEYGNEDENDNVIVVSTDEELKAALTRTDKNIHIVLAEDLSFNVSNAYIQVGGDETETILIDGHWNNKNHKLTLYTTYRSYLDTVNPDAKIVFKNMDLTSSQTSGTWDSYDVAFRCNVDMENVHLLKAMALVGVGKTANLKDVTITETHDYYALWITATGWTVNIEDLNVNAAPSNRAVSAPAGRGIKIDEQYVSDEDKALVTLNIKNAVFNTAKKAAIVVKSAKGAKINADNLDISNVVEDDVFAVWVDEDSKAYADLVVVNGAKKIVEGTFVKVATWEEFTAALVDGNYILFTADISYDNSYTITKNVTIDLNSKTLAITDSAKRINTGNKNDKNAPKPNVTIKNGNLHAKVYAQTGNMELYDIKFGGTIDYAGDAQGVISVGNANLLAERCDMAGVKAGASRPRALSAEGRSNGYLILRDCNFPSSSDGTGLFVKTKLLRTYITPLSGNATLELTNCKFGVACNIDLATSYVWSNLNLKGCSGGFTFTISRASTSFTEVETAIMKDIKKNNSGDVRLDWTDVQKMYIYL